jgi:hypothetical protein
MMSTKKKHSGGIAQPALVAGCAASKRYAKGRRLSVEEY